MSKFKCLHAKKSAVDSCERLAGPAGGTNLLTCGCSLPQGDAGTLLPSQIHRHLQRQMSSKAPVARWYTNTLTHSRLRTKTALAAHGCQSWMAWMMDAQQQAPPLAKLLHTSKAISRRRHEQQASGAA
eukprot:scaffold229163_cov19-Tisochrysis_lutea.AAC.1